MSVISRGGFWPLEIDFDGERHGRSISKMHSISIDAGDWMKREDMKGFMESAAGWQHVGEGNWPDISELPYEGGVPDYADRFMWVDDIPCPKTFDLRARDTNRHEREGSDWELLPEEVAIEISKILDAEGFRYGIVWLKPFDPHD